MRNYFVQLQEVKIAGARLETLIEKKIRLKSKITSCTKELKESDGSGSFSNDKMENYIIKLEEIETEISELKEEIKCLNKNLKVMEQALEDTNGVEQEILLLKYRDNLKVRDIAQKVNYSESRVYQYLDKIKLETLKK